LVSANLDLSRKFVTSHPQLFKDEPVQWNAYNLPLSFLPQRRQCLVLGSGMGNDVARHSATVPVASWP